MGSDNFGHFAGGLWTVWVVASDAESAMLRATDYAAERGWLFSRHERTARVERAIHCGDDLMLQRFDEAQRVGIAAILDTFKTKIVETN